MTPPDPPESPWHTHAARETYRSPWVTVTEYQVTRPDGWPGIYNVVDPRDNATIIALDADGHIWLQREYLYPLARHEVGLPTGAVEPGETPLESAKRELLEEAGLLAARWDLLGSYPLSPGISSQVSHIYLARDLTRTEARPESTERIQSLRMPLDAAYEACLRGEIRTATAVIGIWRTHEAVGREGGDTNE
jgi:8-oxo-dGTP pyrophosphatase MutT (NUDIX family)